LKDTVLLSTFFWEGIITNQQQVVINHNEEIVDYSVIIDDVYDINKIHSTR